MLYDSSGLGVGALVAALVVNAFFAAAVYRDAHEGQPPLYVDPWVWVLATLLGGIVTLAVYWAMHHSTLSRRP